jgi:hypothetical protein
VDINEVGVYYRDLIPCYPYQVISDFDSTLWISMANEIFYKSHRSVSRNENHHVAASMADDVVWGNLRFMVPGSVSLTSRGTE